jgi:hypothetical protein
MMEAVRTSETSVNNHFTWQYIPEDNSEHQRFEAAQMTFMRSLYGMTKRERLRNVDITSELGETNIVEEIEHYWKKCNTYLGCHPQYIHGKHSFID